MLEVDTQPITQIHICEAKKNLVPSKKRKVSEDPVQTLKLKMIQKEIDCRKKRTLYFQKKSFFYSNVCNFHAK